MNPTTAHVLAVIFIATFIRSAFGFGEALVAVPLLSMRLPILVAAPLAVLVSITVAAAIIAQDWHNVHVRSAGWLVLSTLLGIPLGLVLLKTTDERAIKAALALIIIAFSLWSLLSRAQPHLRHDSKAWLHSCGFAAGVLGGAYGMNGPPLVLYGSLRRWSAQHFRATLQGYFLPASVIGMIGYVWAGLWTSAVTRYYLLSLPGVIIAIFLGRLLNNRMENDAFLKVIYIGLIAIGIALLAQAGVW
jgi:uncharacterized membrane protein YfcA